MKKILVVVDMQNDFLTGTLANESAVAIIPNIRREIESGYYDTIVFTRDTHTENYLNTQEGKRLPIVHCLENTEGWEVCEDLVNATKELLTSSEVPASIFYFNKPTFGSVDFGEFLKSYCGECDAEIAFTGTCTDICVVSNALATKASLPEATVKCISYCCAPLLGDEYRQESALVVMESCQIDVIR